MFYCEKCRVERKWPEGFMKSRGNCELCGNIAHCHDRPSWSLPRPPEVDAYLATLRRPLEK
jgi:hypothetical protein